MKILLVEDLRSVAALMASRLITFGHEVVHAENGKAAIDKFREEAPDLVLMDIEMPVMNGFEATNHIRAFEATQQWAWTPIIFLTASDTLDNFITAIEAGGDDFMAKTVPEAVMHAKMKAMARIATLRHRLATANSTLESIAYRDGLTGLCNRRFMDTRLDAALADATRHKAPLSLLMLDIDNFKKYNDHYGHQAGDNCLRSIANAIDTVVNVANETGMTQNAFAARYGGEEFTVVVPDASCETYEKLAATTLSAVRVLSIPHEMNDAWGIATISIGGIRMETAGGNAATLIRTADSQLYKAKESGRNRAELATV